MVKEFIKNQIQFNLSFIPLDLKNRKE